MGTNAKYKASVFSSLFAEPDDMRMLYSALEGVTLPPDVPIEPNTLSDVLYRGRINDISFTFGGRLVIVIEHQSTINPNMPLRLLMYIARIYEKIIDQRAQYEKALKKIPAPEFIVLYNGTLPYPDQVTLKLSDAFEDAAGLRGTIPATPDLELVVKVYNINKGHNDAIVQKCEKLYGYSFFVDKVREMERELPKEEAMKAAIGYCIKHNILKRFLETNSSEVFNMLITEWSIEDEKAASFKEGREEGREEGIEEGRGEGAAKKQEAIVKNALLKGFPFDTIRDLTGIDMEEIKTISATM